MFDKLQRYLDTLFPRLNGRGLIEAQRHPMGRLHETTGFRGLTAAASLKPSCIPHGQVCLLGWFPRLNGRGLIEALNNSGYRAARSTTFPRLNGRGLIEALNNSGYRAARSTTFPRLNGRGLIEAHHTKKFLSRFLEFPRLYGRGLIEANARESQSLDPARFPRLYGRGLIEALKLLTVMGWLPVSFRGCTAAASLKHFKPRHAGLFDLVSAAVRPRPH